MGYARPPLVESTIEFRAALPGPKDILERVAKRLKADYPNQEKIEDYEFEVRPGSDGGKIVNQGISQLNMRSKDGDELVIIKSELIAYLRQPPYPGWTACVEASERLWRVWNKEMGAPKIARLGVRAQNRIDVPMIDGELRPPQDFVSIGVEPLPFAPEALAFRVSRFGPISPKHKMALNVMTGPSPLIDHGSITFDLDIGLAIEVAPNWANIERELAEIHKLRNDIFESCMTDAARELFQ